MASLGFWFAVFLLSFCCLSTAFLLSDCFCCQIAAVNFCREQFQQLGMISGESA
jgi:hypothetical protein